RSVNLQSLDEESAVVEPNFAGLAFVRRDEAPRIVDRDTGWLRRLGKQAVSEDPTIQDFLEFDNNSLVIAQRDPDRSIRRLTVGRIKEQAPETIELGKPSEAGFEIVRSPTRDHSAAQPFFVFFRLESVTGGARRATAQVLMPDLSVKPLTLPEAAYDR